MAQIIKNIDERNCLEEFDKSIFIVLLSLADQDDEVSLAGQQVLISFKDTDSLSIKCSELIQKHAGNKRLHTGEFTSEFVARMTQTMDKDLVLNILNQCLDSLSSHNRLIRGQTSTIIGII